MAQADESAPSSPALKIVYCGPFGSGKTTNLQQLFARLTDRYRSRLLRLDGLDSMEAGLHGEGEVGLGVVDPGHRPTVFYDSLALVVGRGTSRLVIRLVAVPGHTMHGHTRRLLVRGADGLVFVADSSLSLEQNEQALGEMRSCLRDNGLSADSMPMVLQVNKQDSERLRLDLNRAAELRGNRADVALVPARAQKGQGVVETLLRMVAVSWPVRLHEQEALASGLDLPGLLDELGRLLQAPEAARAALREASGRGEPSRSQPQVAVHAGGVVTPTPLSPSGSATGAMGSGAALRTGAREARS
ncbi:MAG: hypothetical protein U1A78_00750 [Polyangia bacterium]